MGRLRVIGGRARGHSLQMVPGSSTRPIGDRVKEALFNILGPAVQGASFLDLFAGTGSVGIEALSRGAAQVVFIENDRLAVRTIRKNLEKTGLEQGARVLQSDAFAYLQSQSGNQFEYVFVAPPQYGELWARTLQVIDARPEILQPDGWVIVQIDPREQQDLELANLLKFDERTYGNTKLLFYEFPSQ